MRCRCRYSRFSQAWMVCERPSILAAFGGDKICRLSSKLLPAANGSFKAATLLHCSTWFLFSSTDNLQSFSFSPNVAILDPSRSSLQSHVEDLSRRSAVSCFLRSSSPVSALYVLRRRSFVPSTTRFSNLGRSFFRTDLASNSLAPPIGRATSYQSD